MAGEQQESTTEYADLDVLLDQPDTQESAQEPEKQPESAPQPVPQEPPVEGNEGAGEGNGDGPTPDGSQDGDLPGTPKDDESKDGEEPTQQPEASDKIEVSVEELESILARSEEDAEKKLAELFGVTTEQWKQKEDPPQKESPPPAPPPTVSQVSNPATDQAPVVPDLGKIDLPEEYEDFKPLVGSVEGYVAKAAQTVFQSVMAALPQYMVPIVAPMVDRGFSWGFAQQDFLSSNPELNESPKQFELAVYEALQENPNYEHPGEVFNKAKEKMAAAQAMRKKIAAKKAKKVDARSSRKGFSANGTPSVQSRPQPPGSAAHTDPQVEALQEIIAANEESI